jgi:hypothetical protein
MVFVTNGVEKNVPCFGIKYIHLHLPMGKKSGESLQAAVLAEPHDQIVV